MPSAPQKLATAKGRSWETAMTSVLSRPAASSLNLRTPAWQTPVPMLGKMSRTVRLPGVLVTSAKSPPVRVKSGAVLPVAGSSPTVWTVLSPSWVVAMASF